MALRVLHEVQIFFVRSAKGHSTFDVLSVLPGCSPNSRQVYRALVNCH